MGGGGADSDASGMSGGEMELDDDDDDDEVHISFACLLESCCPQHLKAFGVGCQGARRQMCRSWTSVTTENCLLAARLPGESRNALESLATLHSRARRRGEP